MRSTGWIVWTLFMVGLCTSAAATAQAQTYLCIAEKSAGFAFDENTKQWGMASFEVSNNKYIVRAPNAGEMWTVPFIVLKMGNSVPSAFCKDGVDKGGLIYCDRIGRLGIFKINTKLGRFLATYAAGYVDENILEELSPSRKEGDDAPSITIGRCSPL